MQPIGTRFGNSRKKGKAIQGLVTQLSWFPLSVWRSGPGSNADLVSAHRSYLVTELAMCEQVARMLQDLLVSFQARIAAGLSILKSCPNYEVRCRDL